jgi:hypothetical protein
MSRLIVMDYLFTGVSPKDADDILQREIAQVEKNQVVVLRKILDRQIKSIPFLIAVLFGRRKCRYEASARVFFLIKTTD